LLKNYGRLAWPFMPFRRLGSDIQIDVVRAASGLAGVRHHTPWRLGCDLDRFVIAPERRNRRRTQASGLPAKTELTVTSAKFF
jgi:hypothetical protein